MGRLEDEKAKLIQNSMSIQTEMTRRGLDLKKLRSEIAALEGSGMASEPAKPQASKASVPPAGAAPMRHRATEPRTIWRAALPAAVTLRHQFGDQAGQ